MIKYLAIIASFLNPIATIHPSIFTKYLLSKPSVVAMAPDGSHLSREATNKINPPGCSVNISTKTKRDGSIETRETLTCTKVKVIKPSGQSSQTPASGSKQDKVDKQLMEKFSS